MKKIYIWPLFLKHNIGGLSCPMMNVWTRQPIHILNSFARQFCKRWSRVCSIQTQNFNVLQYPCIQINLENMKNIESEIFKRTIPGKLDAEMDTCIEWFATPKIQDKYIQVTTRLCWYVTDSNKKYDGVQPKIHPLISFSDTLILWYTVKNIPTL